MKLKITDEKLDELGIENIQFYFDAKRSEVLEKYRFERVFYKRGFRAAEQVHQVTVDKFMEEIKRISDESTHGDNCRAIIYQGIRNCDCHKSEIDKMLKELND